MATEKTIELATQWAAKLQSVIEVQGPKVIDLAMATAQMAALGKLLDILVWLIASGVALWFARKAYLWVFSVIKDADDRFFWCAGLCLPTGIALIIFTVAVSSITNPFIWAGLFRPEIYLAAKALGWV